MGKLGVEYEFDEYGGKRQMKGLGIEIHACENNGSKLMDQVVAGLMGGDVGNG